MRQQEFLPYNLMVDFDHARINNDDHYRPLVKERRIAVPAGVQVHGPRFPLSPVECWLILLTIGLVIFVIECWRKCAILAWELTLMLTAGLMGIVLFLMLFSQHPTVSLNLQLILLNPIHLVYLWPVARKRRTYYWHITAVLCILFLIGSFFQSYAEGIWCLALCLLLQSILHIFIKRQ
jgi:hypothetical protein